MEKLERLKKAITEAFNNKNIYKKSDMAAYLGYNRCYLSSMLNGKEKLTDIFLADITKKLGINMEYITSGVGNMLDNQEAPIEQNDKSSVDWKQQSEFWKELAETRLEIIKLLKEKIDYYESSQERGELTA